MLGYLRLARRTASDEVAARISRAEAEAQRLAGAVDTLLNFARPLEVGSQRLRFDAVVEDVVDRIRAEAPDVQFDCRVVPFEVSGDRELLVRAVDNLVRNAVDAVRERHGNAGGRVQLDLTTQPHPRLTIRDNGVGVDPETAPRLLLPFQSAKPHGFGLGLPLARKIAVHHGATLSLTGVPGEGATAVLDFLPN
jgi:signal transduction histidine kinase